MKTLHAPQRLKLQDSDLNFPYLPVIAILEAGSLPHFAQEIQPQAYHPEFLTCLSLSHYFFFRFDFDVYRHMALWHSSGDQQI